MPTSVVLIVLLLCECPPLPQVISKDLREKGVNAGPNLQRVLLFQRITNHIVYELLVSVRGTMFSVNVLQVLSRDKNHVT